MSSFNNIDSELIELRVFIDSCTTANLRLNNEYRKSLLDFATELGYSEIMQFLISKKGININQKSFDVNIRSGGCECCTIKAKRTERTPLHIAIQKGNINIVKFCLEQPKIDVNTPYVVFDIDVWTLSKFNSYFNAKSGKIIVNMSTLYLAVSNNNIDIIRLLLNHSNIDINMKSTLEKEYNVLIPEKNCFTFSSYK